MSNLYKINYTHSSHDGKFYIDYQIGFRSHRSGWGTVMKSLDSIHNQKSSIKFIGFADLVFGRSMYSSYVVDNIPDGEWVGVLHNPPNLPEWYNYDIGLKGVTTAENFYNIKDNCKGLFTTSKYMKEWLVPRISHHNIPVDVLHHPYTGDSSQNFNIDKYINNRYKKVLDIGTWCRRVSTIYTCDLPEQFQRVKIWPYTYNILSMNRNRIRQMLLKELQITNYQKPLHRVTNMDYVNNEEYDELLSENIVLFDFWDTSANNIVLECIERGTPLLTRRHPATEEYLGINYPLLFDNIEDCNDLLSMDNIINANIHLKKLKEQSNYRLESFVGVLTDTEIYKQI